ncbi:MULTISPECIES: M48 family metallopeptidase [Sulfitobacter]|uniref:M48 family metallopeptidase n=1 Tax=Sulfitobacter TaxID=60136 RepID=UPI002308263B|nr:MULTISPECIES: SprT family zinc-dependent metalloprotease [Sulfitobacter]MDF3381549.1 M48 family metallopeptidase [Sulfitobacter sp. Ks11]MDF3384968.1 M48 family metallopeptidase [Sulfitobacter sp. M85]MDF3388387.1 M48 family metallopeptidase [Sulfitobacter sp. Ks16]MDF3399024.1 M48 family metallopeptidase [Sulfitobacter sp. KE39]MDF3402445.1 M48 family metallopeptidase [Sulfitobacter sp. Ks35]
MKDPVLPGNPPIPLILRRSARARRISLRISQLDGRVTLTMPKRLAEREALAFAESKQDWIRQHLAARGEDVIVAPGAELPVGGKLLRVRGGQGSGVRIGPEEILVPGPEESLGKRLAAHLREVARDRLAGACDDYAALLGKPYARITLRDTRSRWGSCSSDGALMFSWRLIMTPPEVLDYVAAHEVAHLAQMNHSPAFWAEVTRIYGDYQAPRQWLRDHGGGLHRYRF